jgi:hypothetical protein
VNGYFTPLFAMIDHMVAEGFVAAPFAAMLAIEAEPDKLLARLHNFQPTLRKWSSQRGEGIQP